MMKWMTSAILPASAANLARNTTRKKKRKKRPASPRAPRGAAWANVPAEAVWLVAARRRQPAAQVDAAHVRRAKRRRASRPRAALSPKESRSQLVAKPPLAVLAVRGANVRLRAEAPNEARALPAKRRARANAVAELPPKIHKK